MGPFTPPRTNLSPGSISSPLPRTPASIRGEPGTSNAHSHAGERASWDGVRDAVAVPEGSNIAADDRTARRERSDYVIRLDLSQGGMLDHFEQVSYVAQRGSGTLEFTQIRR